MELVIIVAVVALVAITAVAAAAIVKARSDQVVPAAVPEWTLSSTETRYIDDDGEGDGDQPEQPFRPVPSAPQHVNN